MASCAPEMGRYDRLRMKHIPWAICILACALSQAAAQTPSGPGVGDADALAEAVRWIRETDHVTAQYNYSMSVKIRPLLFWIWRDEVGGGYIRRLDSPSDPKLR